jgi:hypothetical protein
MKKLTVLLLWLAVLTTAGGQAPVDVAGFLYVEDFDVLATGGARAQGRTEVLLRPDGVAQGIWQSIERFSPRTTIVGIPSDTHWRYSKMEESRGLLTIGGSDKTLTFNSSESGSVSPPGALTNRNFRLLAYEPSKVANCSLRSFVRSGDVALMGFVVTGPVNNRVLVRAVGPGLARFGIQETLSRPSLTIRRTRPGGVALVGTNAGWGGDVGVAQAAVRSGAFSLEPGSADAALFVSLSADAYVVEVSSITPEASGHVLVELYVLP